MRIEDFDVILKDEGDYVDVIFQTVKSRVIVESDIHLNDCINYNNGNPVLSICSDCMSIEVFRNYCKRNELIYIEF